jgi:hypothetical protein
MRIMVEVAMAATIVFLLFFRPVPERKTIRRTPVPQRMFRAISSNHSGGEANIL